MIGAARIAPSADGTYRPVTEGECIGSELRQEALAYARNRTIAATDRMVALGIPRDLCGELALGVARIELHGRYWEPADHGLTCITLPLWAGDDAIDVLALDVSDERKWWRRADLAPVIDELEIRRAVHFDEPLVIHRTPLAWLRSGGVGTVVLDWDATLGFWLAGCRRFLCHDPSTGARLDKALRSPPPSFEIKLAKEPRNAAA